MEVLKSLGGLILLLSTSCSLLSPSDFSRLVADAGINPMLVQSVETTTTLKVSSVSDVLGFVAGGGMVWIVTAKGRYGYDAQTLDLKVAQEFTAVLPEAERYGRFQGAIWSSALVTTNRYLWTRVNAPSGAGYTKELLTVDAVNGLGSVYHFNFDSTQNHSLGLKGGSPWEVVANPATHGLQFNDAAGAGLVGPVNTVTATTFDHLQSADGVLYAVDDSPALKLGERRFRVRVQEWPSSVWGIASGPNLVSTDVTLPTSFREVSWATAVNYTFSVLKGGGRTFFVPTFGANEGNNTTTCVVVIDDATGTTVASQYVDDAVRVAVDSGEGWFQLGPEEYDNGLVSLPLRKYQW